MTLTPPRRVLVLCTGNSARSILAEALFNAHGYGTLEAFSAGSQPKDNPHPAALTLLSEKGFDTGFAASKSWDVFAGPDVAPMDMIVTVCDSAASEACPVWPGHPATVHWGIPDPAAVTEPEDAVRAAFETAYGRLDRRVRAFLSLPFAELSEDEALRRAREIGKTEDQAPELAHG